MNMDCNIGLAGRWARGICGFLCLILGIWLLCTHSPGAWAFWAGLLLLPAGLFQIYEAIQCWCIVRALGFKTWM